MPVPAGTASLLDIQNEFGGSYPISLNEYYGAADGVPASGNISINNLRGKSSEVLVTATNAASYNLQTAFGANWTVNIAKRFRVPSGVTIGPTTIPSGLAGTLIFENIGEVQGASGAANSGAGGNAITASSSFTLLNSGAVRGGGGGGGRGGNGGAGGTGGGGSYSTTSYYTSAYTPYTETNSCNTARGDWCAPVAPGGGGWYRTGCTQVSCCMGDKNSVSCTYQKNVTTNTNGGAGGGGGSYGNGGRGQGYGIALAAGSGGANGAGGAGGGTNAGAGGTGGTGGTGGAGRSWGLSGLGGASGATGATGANGNRTGGSAGSGGAAGVGGGGAGRAILMSAGTLSITNSGTMNGAY